MGVLLDISRRIESRLDSERIGAPIEIQGALGLSKGLILAALARSLERSILLVGETARSCEEIYVGARALLGKEAPIFHFPPLEILPYEETSPHARLTARRIKTLARIKNLDRVIVVTSIEALWRRIAPPEAVASMVLPVDRGDEIDRDAMVAFLASSGYESTSLVDQPGQFAMRGGIVDIYSYAYDSPIRVELFGDEIESMRFFDSGTQRSIKRIERALIPAMREANYSLIDGARAARAFRERSRSGSSTTERIADLIEREEFFDGMENQADLFQNRLTRLFEYMPTDSICLIEEERSAFDRLERLERDARRALAERIEEGSAPAPMERLYEPVDLIRSEIGQRAALKFHALKIDSDSKKSDSSIQISAIEPTRSSARLSQFADSARALLADGYKVVAMASNLESARSLRAALLEFELAFTILDRAELGELVYERMSGARDSAGSKRALIGVAPIARGIILESERLAIFSENEIVGRLRGSDERRPKRATSSAARSSLLARGGIGALAPNDYVVHRTHGIGRYLSARSLSVGESTGEYLEIEYADDQRLYLPIFNVHLLKRHLSARDGVVLDKMGSSNWARRRAKAKKSAVALAGKLLKRAALRELSDRIGFSPEGAIHREFASKFEHHETPDQMKAIEETLADMEKSRPMDRVVCGDVGYGKTEIALRAAFKAFHDGRQTAILCPTTLLARQHHETFSKRFAPFSARIETLSSMVDGAAARAILDATRSGSLDILIGTSRILSPDVVFKSLGLIVIDEEHRFGARAKERFASMAPNLDRLTLTATPIPRTLNSAIVGIRDLSTIQTPPAERLSTLNRLARFSKETILEACSREIARGGQVFFVHNKIANIERMARWLGELIPTARVCHAHGAMSPAEIEERMRAFLDREYDILVTTTIIESGLDIPSVNTILINRAERLGLSQLYQLRGRIGRAGHRAYCYFLIPSERALTANARERLIAARDLSDLGSGFTLATKDMEIRGVGDLLGADQSGHIEAIGLDGYLDMLNETIEKLKGNARPDAPDLELNLAPHGALPPDYVPLFSARLEFHNKLSETDRIERIREIARELRDRFGRPPEETLQLIGISMIAARLRRLGAIRADSVGARIKIRFDQRRAIDRASVSESARAVDIDAEFIAPDIIQLSRLDGAWRARFRSLDRFLAGLARDAPGAERG